MPTKQLLLAATMLVITCQLAAQDLFKCGITGEMSAADRREVKANIEALLQSGVLRPTGQLVKTDNETLSTTSSIRFEWPMQSAVPKYFTPYMSKNFVDLDPSAGVLDYNGGDHTYDTHNGMDVGIGPYYWEMQRAGEVYGVASAPGVIVGKRDGGYDDNCDWGTWQGAGASGNYVAILHNDGHTVSYYKHLRNGSVTTLPLGTAVNTGTYMGAIASSGRSTGPHMHFEVHIDYVDADNTGKLIEPFYGVSNTSIGESLWANQLPYEQPEIMAMESWSFTAPWYIHGCDTAVGNLADRKLKFQPGESIRVRTFFRDWTSGLDLGCFMQDPNGNLHRTWTWTNPDKYRFRFTEYVTTIPANATNGTWRFAVSFNNKTYSHYFTVGNCTPSHNLAGLVHTNSQGYVVSGNITSTSTIAGSSQNMVQYKADGAVILSPGFLAARGCVFYANNEGCNNGVHH